MMIPTKRGSPGARVVRVALVATAAAVAWAGLPQPAAAYIGPGAALSLLGAFWGVLVAVGTAVAFALAWPVRRYLRRRRARRDGVASHGAAVARSAGAQTVRPEPADPRGPFGATEA